VAKTSVDSAHLTVDAVANSLRIEGIAFRGPLCSQGKRIVFVVESHIFLESELAGLLAGNSPGRIQATNTKQ
jgi:hypothetical protein